MKKRILLIVLIIFIIFIGVFSIIPKKNITNNNIKKYLLSKEFITTNDEYLVKRQLSKTDEDSFNNDIQNNSNSEYEALFFNTYTYELFKDSRIYYNGVLIELLPKYDYKNNLITYSYKINSDNTNTIINGSYDEDKNFKCDISFSATNISNDEKQNICNSIKYKIKDFDYEASTLITSIKLLNEMKSK